MKPGIPLLILLGLSQLSFAVTHAVLPGESIQTKVDAAVAGDIVAISAGTYPGDVTINKAIRLVEMDENEVTITGNVTFTGVTNAPPFEGFTVGSSGKGITITDTTGMVLKNIDARQGFGLRVNGNSSVNIVTGQYSAISQDGGTLMASGPSVVGDFTASINCVKTMAFRANVTGNASWNSSKSWFGYSKAWHFKSVGVNSKIVIVGSEIDGRNYMLGTSGGDPNPASYTTENIGVDIGGSGNSVFVSNCVIKGMTFGYYKVSNWLYPGAIAVGRGIWIRGTQRAEIFNNYVQLYYFPSLNGTSPGEGVRAEGSNCKIYNNIFDTVLDGIYAPFGTDVRNNFYFALQRYGETGGVVSIGGISGDPLFIAGQNPKLQAASPCINAGVSDPIFNDLDGTRNDIGPGGGCLFDPQGSTTSKPVVISFDLAPQQLLRGVDTQVNLTNGLAAGQP